MASAAIGASIRARFGRVDFGLAGVLHPADAGAGVGVSVGVGLGVADGAGVGVSVGAGV